MYKNVIFALDHPDDEVIRCANLINFFKKNFQCKVFLIFFSNQNTNFNSENFSNLKKILDYDDYFAPKEQNYISAEKVITEIDIEKIFSKSLDVFGINKKDLDLVISHPYYGDETNHPHHIYVSHDLRKICRKRAIDFACFSPIVFPQKNIQLLKKIIKTKNNFIIYGVYKYISFFPFFKFLHIFNNFFSHFKYTIEISGKLNKLELFMNYYPDKFSENETNFEKVLYYNNEFLNFQNYKSFKKFFDQIKDYENMSRENYFSPLRYLGYIMFRSFPKMRKIFKK